MVFRLLGLLIFACLAFTLNARADEEFQKVVSFQQLMRLPKAKQLEYVQTLRAIQLEFNDAQKQFSSRGIASYTDRLNHNTFVDLLLQEAFAAPSSAADNQYAPCPNSLLSKTPHIRNALVTRGAKISCIRPKMGCANGYYELGERWEGRKVCYLPGLSPAARARLAAAKKARDDANKRAQQQSQWQQLEAARKAANAGAQRLADQRRQSARTRRQRLAARLSTATPNDRIDTIANDAGDDAEIAANGGVDVQDTTHDVHSDLPSFQIAKKENGDPDALWQVTPINLDAPGAKCDDVPAGTVPDSCTDANIAKAKRAMYQDSGPHCLFAGNLSHYANKQKRPGNCQKVHEFCLTRVTCRDENNQMQTSETPIIKCDGGKILCNPLVFNLDQNDQGLCVPTNADATTTCDARADEVKAAMGEKYVPFIARIQLNEQGDLSNGRALRGVKDAWDDYRAEMNKLCFKEPTKDVYCRECAVLKKRVALLNLATFSKTALASSEPDSAGNCFYFKAFTFGNTSDGGATNTGNADRSSP